MSNKLVNWLTPHKCHICGKSFYPAPYHVYKDARIPHGLVCSYPCRRESERLLQKEREARPPKKIGQKPKSKNNKEK